MKINSWMWHVCSLSLARHPCSAWLSTTCLNVIFILVFCQKINFLWVCSRAEHMATALWRWQPSGAGARQCCCPALAADAPGFSTIKWRSSLFSLSTAVPCTLKCSVNHCLPPCLFLHKLPKHSLSLNLPLTPHLLSSSTHFVIQMLQSPFFSHTHFKHTGRLDLFARRM